MSSSATFASPSSLTLGAVVGHILREHATDNDAVIQLGFAAIYFLIFFISDLLLFPLVFSRMFFDGPVKREVSLEWSSRIGSTINAVFVSFGGIRVLYLNPSLLHDYVLQNDPVAYFYFNAFMGYLLYDTVIVMVNHRILGTPSTYFHHIALYVLPFLGMRYNILTGLGVHYLLFELTTPSLNIRWFLIKLVALVPPSLFTLNNVMFVLLFFLFRIVMNYATAIRAMIQSLTMNNRAVALCVVADVCVIGVNSWWFYLIIQGVFSHGFGTRQSKPKEKKSE